MEVTYHQSEIGQIAKKIVNHLGSGDVLALVGELGSGKTTLTQAILHQLGYRGKVASPTFVLERRYPLKEETKGIKEISHLDLYRLNSQQLASFDWRESLGQSGSLTIIEWPEIVLAHLPAQTKRISLKLIDGQTRQLQADFIN